MDIRRDAVLRGPDGADVVVVELCGRGGLGVVYKARLPNGDLVAVKTMITGGLDASELASLQNEAQLARRVQDEHVVRVLHFEDGEGLDGVPPYLIMEFVAGGSLRDLIRGRAEGESQFTPEELVDIFEQVAAGMAAVNEHVVHRDLKPENVLVDADRRILKVTDFGLAKLVGATTRTATFKGGGTYPYMSPEAFDLETNTPAMDVYAAGVMFHELATLRLPFQPGTGGDARGMWRRAHREAHPTPLAELRPDLPGAISLLVSDMLAKSPAGRPSTWEEVRRRLGAESKSSGAPDVSGLIAKAVESRARRSAAAARAEEEREREADRLAILTSAWRTPLGRLAAIIRAFNEESGTTELRLDELGPFRAAVRSESSRSALMLAGTTEDDLPMGHHGFARITALVQLDPIPAARSKAELSSRESFGGFNLIYRVRQPSEEFGDWVQLRFEHNPLTGRGQYPHWFAFGGAALQRELKLLSAMGTYQHQLRPLEDEWLMALLTHLL